MLFCCILFQVNGLQFPDECNAVQIIKSRAKCRPHPSVEVMMDHITLKGKKSSSSTIKRLVPSHVIINKCAGTFSTFFNFNGIQSTFFVQLCLRFSRFYFDHILIALRPFLYQVCTFFSQFSQFRMI